MKGLEGWPTIHYTEMPGAQPDSPLYREDQTFTRELPRLLAEGHEGKWVLIKGEEIIGLFDSLDEGERAGRQRFLMTPFLVQPVSAWQPLLRGTWMIRYAAPKLPAQ